jgi:superfamily II DNA or RNA helicase
MSDRRLFPNQASFLTDIRLAALNHLAVCGTAPTGSGKGDILAHMTVTALDKLPRRESGDIGCQRIAITVPYISLVDDMVGRLVKWGVPENWIGVFQALHPKYNPGAPVQVCSVDTLSRRNMRLPVDLLLVDECHLLCKWLTAWIHERTADGKRTVGLTATPWAKGMGKVFSTLVCSLTMREHIDTGLLCDFDVYCAPEKPALPKKMVAGDYHQGDLSTVMQGAALLADAVSEYRKRLWGKPVIVFCVDRKHARKLQGEYEAAGIRTAYVDCYTKRKDRAVIGEQLREGTIWVVFCVRCLAVGVDWPFVAGIQICRPTVNPMLLVQMLGRGMRTSPGKDRLIILDHGQSILKLGFPDDLSEAKNEDGLNGGAKGSNGLKERKARVPLPLECPRCHMVRKPGVNTCPSCGFTPDPGKLSKVTFAAGELAKAQRKPKVKATKEEKQRWYGMLIEYANSKGYQDGWASRKYKDRFGVWPTDHACIRNLDGKTACSHFRKHPLRVMPDAEVMAFINASNRAYRAAKLSGQEARP